MVSLQREIRKLSDGLAVRRSSRTEWTNYALKERRYAIPNFHVAAHDPKVNVPVTQWRSVGYTHNTFVVETLVDELAMRAKVDPIALPAKTTQAGCQKTPSAHFAADPTKSCIEFADPFSQIRN